MVGILGLQRAHQYLKRRKFAEIFKARVLQKKRPARESAANTSLQPIERVFSPPQQGKNTSDLIVAVVRMPKGFWVCTSLGQAVECLSVFPRHCVINALQTDDEWFFG
jgi:hypothetical protein